MANGFSLGILQLQKEVTGNATPEFKVEPYGLLGSLKTAHSPGVIKNDSFDGHFKTVKIKSKQRYTPSQTTDEASCDETNVNPYAEQTVSVDNFRQLAFHIEDEVIAAFDSYASGKTTLNGNPSAPMMFEFMEELNRAASALLSAVNQDLWVLAAAAIGVNRATGVNTAQTINIPLTNTSEPLGNGINKILRDYKKNTMMGKPIVVGSGNFHGFMLGAMSKGGVNQAGVDTRIQAAGFDFWYDDYIDTALAANDIVVYEKDAIQLVEYLKYQGFKSGPKPGASFFFTTMLPMVVGDQLVPVQFDAQLRYNDCAQDFTVDGDTTTLEKGYNLILSKTFGLYTIPATAYRSGDPLEGNRGSLRFNITNS